MFFFWILTKEQNVNIHDGNKPGIRSALRQVAPYLPQQPDPIAGFRVLVLSFDGKFKWKVWVEIFCAPMRHINWKSMCDYIS